MNYIDQIKNIVKALEIKNQKVRMELLFIDFLVICKEI